MERKQWKEREIQLSDLLWNVALGWRLVICSMLVLAILAGGFQYLRDSKAYMNSKRAAESNIQATKESLAKNLSQEDLNFIDTYTQISKLLKRNYRYNAESILMNINSFETEQATIQYYVDSGYTYNYTKDNKADYTGNLVESYCNYASSSEIVEKILSSSDIQTEHKYLKELIEVSMGIEKTFTVKIRHNDEEEIKVIAENIKRQLDAYIEEMQKSIGAHQLVLISEDIDRIVDTELAGYQKQRQDETVSLKGQLGTLTTQLTRQQQQYLDADNSPEDEMDVVEVAVNAPAIDFKYVLLGLALGIFLAVAILTLKLVFSGRLMNSGELKDNFGLRLFGTITSKKSKRKFLSIIDDGIIKLKNRRYKQFNFEQQLNIANSNLEIACEKEGIRALYFTGTEWEHLDQDLLSKIKAYFEKAGIKVHCGENINYNVKSMKEMVEVNHVIFIEQPGISLYQEISNELQLAAEHHVNVLGAIAII